jgi:DNA invertase Pin-like site-specific DNA recombinase
MMTGHPYSSKITPEHLARKAVVYVRQSSLRQVRENKESQRLQYSLADRAREWGWKHVEIIDCDLGSSATLAAAEREGFERLIASVALKEVGILLSREASRLWRTNKDWCRLFEVCQVFGTLISNGEAVYDLGLLDDQAIVGIKGTLSVVEIGMLKRRLVEAAALKAQEGRLIRLLAPGYVRDGEGTIVKDPDSRVRGAIEVVFRKFRELRSVRQTFLWFHEERVELPVNKSRGGHMRLVWQLPTHVFVQNILENPIYAGAYVWGRRPVEVVFENGQLRKRTGSLRRAEECKAFIRDHHEGYIDWETFQENLRMISSNNLKVGGDESVAAVRAGQGLLVRLLRCGRCGRLLHVAYWGKSGTAARYLCRGDYAAGGTYCTAFGGSTVDRRFGKELLEVLSPLGMRAGLAALRLMREKGTEVRGTLLRQLEQLEYEERRAFEQYDEVDPRNRLVAAELERRWNAKIGEVEKLKAELAEKDHEARELGAEEEEKIMELGENFQNVWQSERCPVELKKKIIRTVVEEVIVTLDEAGKMLHFVIHWKGGTHTEFTMPKPPSGVGQKTTLEDMDIIRRMTIRYSDSQIAATLNKLGRRTGKGKRWNKSRVKSIRVRSKMVRPSRVDTDLEILSLGSAAKYCGVSECTIKRLVASGLLKKDQICPWAPWEIKRSDLDAEPVHGIIKRLLKTGKLKLEGGSLGEPLSLFPENEL